MADAQYKHDHYIMNKERYREAQKRSRARKIEKLRKYKESNPCVDCDTKYPHYVMEFDHHSIKTMNIASMVTRYGWDRLMQEIECCDLLCANCHAIRTWERSQGVLW